MMKKKKQRIKQNVKLVRVIAQIVAMIVSLLQSDDMSLITYPPQREPKRHYFNETHTCIRPSKWKSL